jgi:hypothetical protein
MSSPVFLVVLKQSVVQFLGGMEADFLVSVTRRGEFTPVEIEVILDMQLAPERIMNVRNSGRAFGDYGAAGTGVQEP